MAMIHHNRFLHSFFWVFTPFDKKTTVRYTDKLSEQELLIKMGKKNTAKYMEQGVLMTMSTSQNEMLINICNKHC